MNTLKFHVKGIVGRLLGILFPEKRALVERYATIPWHYKPGFGRLEQLIRAGIFYSKGRKPEEKSQITDLHQNFWENQLASEYYSNTQNRFQETFMPFFSVYLNKLDELLIELNIESIVEIGTGDGQLLQYLSERWPNKKYVGLDLSSDQITENKKNYQSTEIEFYAGDALNWVKAHSPSRTLYVTGLGVLEYFDYDKLLEILRSTSPPESIPTALFLSEPVYQNANMDIDFASYSGGNEKSFTHAYPKILEREGWTVIESNIVEVSDHRVWVGTAFRKA